MKTNPNSTQFRPKTIGFQAAKQHSSDASLPQDPPILGLRRSVAPSLRPSFTIRFSLFVILWAFTSVNAQSGGDYAIISSTIDSGGGMSTSPSYSLTGTIGQADAGGALSGGAYSLSSGFWSPAGVEPPPEGFQANPGKRARFISFQVPAPAVATGGTATAIKVELISIASPPGAPSGSQVRWVNAFDFNGSNHGAMPIVFTDAPPNCPNEFAGAVLGCEPEYRDWASEVHAVSGGDGALYVLSLAIVPSSTYTVTHVSKSGAESASLQVVTALWGDAADPVDIVNVIDFSNIRNHLLGVGAPCRSFAWMKVSGTQSPGVGISVIDLGLVANVLSIGQQYPGPAITVCP